MTCAGHFFQQSPKIKENYILKSFEFDVSLQRLWNVFAFLCCRFDLVSKIGCAHCSSLTVGFPSSLMHALRLELLFHDRPAKKTNRPTRVGRCHGVNSLMASLRQPTSDIRRAVILIARFGWARWWTESQLKLKMLRNKLLATVSLDGLGYLPKYSDSTFEFRSPSFTSNFELHRITTCSAHVSRVTASYIHQLQSFFICAQSANQGPINFAARSFPQKTLIRKQWPSRIKIIPWYQHGNGKVWETTKDI